jgi:peptidoglycan/xylan/chitin deacetylase (PgdA/CDA1 family)
MTAREWISYTLRITVSHALYYAGVLHLLQRVRLRGKAVVLMYHRVLPSEQRLRTASQQGLVVDEETFARQIAFLKRLFHELTLDEFADRLARREPFERPSCLITFDDGWIDNFDHALPVLREQGVPAVMFLPVNFIGSRRLFIREALTHLLVKAVETSRRESTRRDGIRQRLAPLGFDSLLDVEDIDPLPAVLEAVGAHRYASGPQFEALVTSLSAELGISNADLPDVDSFVDWSQVEAMSRQGFSFGGHGAEHRVLTQVAPDVVRCEVETSKNVLDARLSRPVRAFAYPNGAWNTAVADAVRRAGYTMAFTIEAGAVSCEDDRFALPRVNIHEGMTRSPAMFMARLTGVF